jgi:polyhydroxyalkanoate synthesis repressor PhaR
MAGEPILIKKYSNRKLYDSTRSRYITLEEIAGLIRGGNQVRVVDSASQEDLTTVTLAQIILEEEKKRKNHLPVSFLHQLIQYGQSLQHLFQRQLFSNLHALMTTQAQAGELWREWITRGWMPVAPVRRDTQEPVHDGRPASEPEASSLGVELASLRESLERLEQKIREAEQGRPRDG